MADIAIMLDPDASILIDPITFAQLAAALLGHAASLLDQVAARTAEPTWRWIAIELDRAALKLREVARLAAIDPRAQPHAARSWRATSAGARRGPRA